MKFSCVAFFIVTALFFYSTYETFKMLGEVSPNIQKIYCDLHNCGSKK